MERNENERWRGYKCERITKPFEFTQFKSKFKIQTYLENANVGEMVQQLMHEMGHVIGIVYDASIMMLQLIYVH